ncbi:MAG TPA: hypothetical protein VGF48_25735 [Thermoanaerobaculia bacterium]|jgi:hypothetical protein
MTSIAFVACVERGELERKTILLCRTIRRFYPGAPILTFQPRLGTIISAETLATLRDLGVQHSTAPLNTDFAHYAIGNKIFASARAEEIAREEVLVFLDSDTVFVNPPRELHLRDGIDAAARPVDIHRGPNEPPHDHPTHWLTRHRRVSSTGEGDPMDPYWRRMYEILNLDCGGNATARTPARSAGGGVASAVESGGAATAVQITPFVETTCSPHRIRAYCNSGLIAVRRSAGLFAQWREDFLALVRANHIPGEMHYMDQLSLAATLTRVWDRVDLLDGRYNYPLPGRESLREPYRSMPLEDLVHIHYNAHYERVAEWLEPAEVPCS